MNPKHQQLLRRCWMRVGWRGMKPHPIFIATCPHCQETRYLRHWGQVMYHTPHRYYLTQCGVCNRRIMVKEAL